MPVLLRVRFWVLIPPVSTVPKSREVGLTDSTELCDTPLPDKGTNSGEPGALLRRLKLPLAVPHVEGENCTVSVPLWPGPRVHGSESPVRL